MKILFRSVLVSSFVLAVSVIPAIGQGTADDIVEKHLAALGGRQALTKLTSRRATGTVSISTPGGDLAGAAELLSKAPNKSKVSIELDLSAMGVADKMVVEQKFDGTVGWTINSMQGDAEITGNQLENMKGSFFPTPLLVYKTSGGKVEAQPREDIEGKSMLVVLYTPKSGSPARMYFDPDTYLMVRTRMTMNVPQLGGDVEQVGDLSDYRTVDGIKVPFMVINANTQQTVTIKLAKVEHNVEIADSVFSAKAPIGLRSLK